MLQFNYYMVPFVERTTLFLWSCLYSNAAHCYAVTCCPFYIFYSSVHTAVLCTATFYHKSMPKPNYSQKLYINNCFNVLRSICSITKNVDESTVRCCIHQFNFMAFLTYRIALRKLKM